MIRVDKYNYEAFFLDYWENRLTEQQEAELFRFLKANPDLRPVFESFEGIRIDPETDILHPNKENLKSDIIEGSAGINAGNYEEYLIAASENDLDEQEHRHLDAFLHKNPAIKSEFRLFRLARMKADDDILFSHKDKLYQKASGTITLKGMYRLAAAAALILISFGLYQLFFNSGSSSGTQRYKDYQSLSMETIPAGPIHHHTLPGPQLQPRQLPSISLSLPYPKYDPITTMPLLAYRSELQTSSQNNKTLALQLPYLPVRLIIDDYLYDQQRQYLAEQGPRKERSLFGRIIGGLFNRVSDEVEPTLSATKELREGKLSFWDLAESGIDGYNYITNNDVLLVRTLDKKGKTRKVRLLSNNQ